MATWPEANQKRTNLRNATLELLSDGIDRHSRSGQSNTCNRQVEFDNLALSVELDGRAMSEVSSFHTDSLCSQPGGLQVSVASQLSAEASYTTSYRTNGPFVTIGCVSIVVTFFLLVIGGILVSIPKFKNEQKAVKIACKVLTAAGLFGFTGGVTNWLGIKLIFNRIPGVFFSGAITKNFATAKKLIANFILEAFFQPFTNYQLERLVNSASAEEVINEQLDIFMGTPQGLRLRMLGVTKAKLSPLVKPHLLNLKSHIVPLLLSTVESVELLNADYLREQIVDLISTRTHELSAQQVKLLVKDAVYRHLSWIVFWGSVLGAIVGCAAELASIYIKGA
ncbi:hypothetical protein OS493_015724 [Desmophyllum pertusum]|uniref:DUF445 domain-containing protein n=1 Tax=Desmophyllum pertusum TaxID=174260 RepID=A0A9W9YPA4_9CNID|nr:hypothetical protein OS493_015724 [Desmophyllum pertusum]